MKFFEKQMLGNLKAGTLLIDLAGRECRIEELRQAWHKGEVLMLYRVVFMDYQEGRGMWQNVEQLLDKYMILM